MLLRDVHFLLPEILFRHRRIFPVLGTQLSLSPLNNLHCVQYVLSKCHSSG
jgi:hypothetical protein